MLLEMVEFYSLYGWVIFKWVCIEIEIQLYFYVSLHVFICSSVDGCLGCCHILTVINNTVMKGVPASFLFIYTRWGGCWIFESHGISIFSFLMNLQNNFHSGYNNWKSHQKNTRGPFPPHPQQHLLFAHILMISI